MLLNYFRQLGRYLLCLWFENTAREGDKVGGDPYILRRQWPLQECVDAHIKHRHKKRQVLGKKKQRPSRRGVARALEPLEGGKGLIDIFIHENRG